MARSISDADRDALIDAARSVREQSYSPYSGFRVGAAVLDEHGRIHTGCNVENIAYPESVCAEANAIGAMVAAGGRLIAAIAAVGGSNEIEPCTPCGGCRQRIAEFADGDTRVVLIGENGKPVELRPQDLLPDSFRF